MATFYVPKVKKLGILLALVRFFLVSFTFTMTTVPDLRGDSNSNSVYALPGIPQTQLVAVPMPVGTPVLNGGMPLSQGAPGSAFGLAVQQPGMVVGQNPTAFAYNPALLNPSPVGQPFLQPSAPQFFAQQQQQPGMATHPFLQANPTNVCDPSYGSSSKDRRSVCHRQCMAKMKLSGRCRADGYSKSCFCKYRFKGPDRYVNANLQAADMCIGHSTTSKSANLKCKSFCKSASFHGGRCKVPFSGGTTQSMCVCTRTSMWYPYV